MQQDDIHYRYDRAGRLVSRQQVQAGYRGQVWRYRWDSRNQLRQLETPDGKRWEYEYDSFGRRISKRSGDEEVRFLWDGDQPAEIRHYHKGECISRRHWVHNGWELVVQQRQSGADKWETDFVTSDQNGAPQALYGDDGIQRWAAPKATLWGRRVPSHDSLDPGLAFAGQYRDSESGLCYNRFRYYDPTGGCYISPDPIGILGGESNYGYVPNPVGWVDPLGLTSCQLSAAMLKDGTPRPVNSAAHHIVPETAKGAQPARKILKDHGIDINGPDNGVFLPNRNNTDGLSGILHNGKHPDDYISAINDRIKAADELGGKQGVLDELKNISDILSSANRDSSWYKILT